MAGAKTSAKLTFPLPNASTVSTQAAAAPTFVIKEAPTLPRIKSDEPGTVTELRSVVAMRSVIPNEWRYSMLSFSGARPDPLSALTVLVLES
jgi:hypothetical protein